jgi:hypothetical protein
MLLISDANILIDFADGLLLEQMFLLEDTFAVPDTLFEEELASGYPILPGLGLVLLSLNGESVNEAYLLRPELHGRDAPSLNDLFALMLAKQNRCPLLTGDSRLRKLIRERYTDIRVHGTLWVMNKMFESGLVDFDRAERAYDLMLTNGSRLPVSGIREQLRDFQEEEER